MTSIHISEYEVDARDTKLGPEEITREIPNRSEDMLGNLDADGVIRIGAEDVYKRQGYRRPEGCIAPRFLCICKVA